MTLSHPALGLHIDLPPGFVDTTPDILRRHQAQMAQVAQKVAGHADISAEPVLAFDDEAGTRGCLISRLTTRDSAFPGISKASQMALAITGMQGQRLTQQSTPWPLLVRGQSIGLGSDGSLPARPLAQAVVSSQPGRMGTQPGWLVVTAQQWPASAGPMQGTTQMATLVTDLGLLQGERHQWLMAQCAASHMPDYVAGYLGELLDAVRDARWPGPVVAGTLPVQASAPVPQ